MRAISEVDEHHARHCLQFLLVCASVMFSVAGTVLVWTLPNGMMRMIALLAIILSTGLFIVSHLIAAYLAGILSKNETQDIPETQTKLRKKTVEILQRRKMKQMTKQWRMTLP